MTRKMEEHVWHRYIFNLNFFYQSLGESTDAEPTDVEDTLHVQSP